MIPVREATMSAIVKALKERIISTFSVPEVVVSDNAQRFTSREFRHFSFEMGTKHVTTSPYYPKPLQAERFNKNLRAALIAYHSDAHDTWDQQLTWLQFAFNVAEHEFTKTAPFVFMFPFWSGSPLLNLWKVNKLLPEKCNKKRLQRKWDTVKQNLYNSRSNLEKMYNHNRVPQPFKVCDIVYYKYHTISHAGRQIAAKLMPRYTGQFKLTHS
jgi:transposase InsO family protein